MLENALGDARYHGQRQRQHHNENADRDDEDELLSCGHVALLSTPTGFLLGCPARHHGKRHKVRLDEIAQHVRTGDNPDELPPLRDRHADEPLPLENIHHFFQCRVRVTVMTSRVMITSAMVVAIGRPAWIPRMMSNSVTRQTILPSRSVIGTPLNPPRNICVARSRMVVVRDAATTESVMTSPASFVAVCSEITRVISPLLSRLRLVLLDDSLRACQRKDLVGPVFDHGRAGVAEELLSHRALDQTVPSM